MVEWVTPALTTHKPQTDAEAEECRKNGRRLPVPEVLQPTLDEALPVYEPRKDIAIAGRIKAAASDVLPGLVKLAMSSSSVPYPNEAKMLHATSKPVSGMDLRRHALDNATAPSANLILDSLGGLLYREFLTGPVYGWQSWVRVGGALQGTSPTTVNGQLYTAGRDPADELWWNTVGGWTWIGYHGLAAGNPVGLR